MKIKDILLESPPLPEDWNHDMYNDRVPFAQRIRYAKERASQVGVGSSRVAFVIPYRGRKTVLKIAKNRKGMVQQQLEVDILSDGHHGRRGITIPIIDYDERNAMPTWIHTEFAEKIRSENQLEQMINRFTPVTIPSNITMDNIHSYLKEMQTGRRYFGKPNEEQMEAIQENIFIERLTELAMDFDLAVADIVRKSNWGIYKGNPVLIDLGASNDIISTYYK